MLCCKRCETSPSVVFGSSWVRPFFALYSFWPLCRGNPESSEIKEGHTEVGAGSRALKAWMVPRRTCQLGWWTSIYTFYFTYLLWSLFFFPCTNIRFCSLFYVFVWFSSWLTSSFIQLWLEKMPAMISVFLYLLRCVLWPHCSLSWRMFHVHLRRVCVLLFLERMFCILSIKSICTSMSLKASDTYFL